MTVNPLSPEQLRIAAQIDSEVARLLKQGGDEALLAGVHPLMQRFKPMLDTAKPGELDRLCSIYPDFAHLRGSWIPCRKPLPVARSMTC